MGATEAPRGGTSAAGDQEASAEREEMFRAVSELTSDYVYSMTVSASGELEWDWVTGGYERVMGETSQETRARGGWANAVHPDDLSIASEAFQTLMTEHRSVSSEFRIFRADGEVRTLRSWTTPVARDGRVVRIYGAVQDVTERALAEERLQLQNEEYRRLYAEAREQELQLQEANSLLRATLDSTADGILVVDLKGRITAYNRKFREMWRIPTEVVDARDDERAIEVASGQLKDPKAFAEKVRKLYDNPETSSYDVIEFKDGRVFERFSQPQVLDGRVAGRVWSFRDVTEAREADRQIRGALDALRRADEDRRRLLSHLVSAKEDERNRLASDIHDDSVQVMTSVAMGLERLDRQRGGDNHELLARLEETTRAAISRLRKMVFELRPPALDAEGLAAALRVYLEEFRLETGISAALDDRLEDEPPTPLRVVLYRIAQEALTNVKKHSGASTVEVSLEPNNDGTLMEIVDDGRGFSPSATAEGVPGHIGIAEMRERAQMVGGNIWFRDAGSGGACVHVWIPHPPQNDDG